MSATAAQVADGLASTAAACRARLAAATTEEKNAALLALSRRLVEERGRILEANAKDLDAGQASGLSKALMDRLKLDDRRINAMAEGVRQIIALPDPIGAVDSLVRRPNGLQVGRMRIPLGVICIIYESRPNVTVDAGALCLKSGNVPLLKGGKEAFHSNGVLVELMRESLAEVGLPADGIQAVATSDRAVTDELVQLEGKVDLVIPRGGEGLIRHITATATVPVIQHYKGVCHVYVDADADLATASDIAFNAKVQRPGVCNAMETLLIARPVAQTLVPQLFPRFEEAGVRLRGDRAIVELWPSAEPATDEDWGTEYLDLVLSVAVVDDIDAAIAHIGTYGSGHTEAIVTNNYAASQRFMREVNSSCVLVNASTRFNDGFELGLGAEIGISTTKMHAYGPMGLEELTARKFVVFGGGQIRT